MNEVLKVEYSIVKEENIGFVEKVSIFCDKILEMENNLQFEVIFTGTE